jgi:Flp pilus assembly protein TadD
MLRRPLEAWGLPALLVLLTAAAFANAVPNGFVWIDHWQVESGGLIAHSLAQLWSAFHEPLGSIPGWDGPAPYARPLMVAALSAVQAAAGSNPAAYHLVLVGMHLANVLLTYSILLTLTAAPATAFFAAAVFAAHPLQTAAVSWISGISDPLCTLCVLLAFRLQLAASQRTGRGLLLRLGAVLSFALALGAKETALVFPGLLAAAYFLFPLAPPGLRLGAVPDALTSRSGSAQEALPVGPPSFRRRRSGKGSGASNLPLAPSLVGLSIFSSGRPSRRRQKKAAPQGKRFCCCSQETISAHPEEVPSFGTVSKGVVPVYRQSLVRKGNFCARYAAALAPFILLVAADFAYRHLVLGSGALGGGLGRIPLAVRLWTVPRLLVSYLTLPLRFSAITVCDDYALSTGLDPASLAAAGAITALLLGVVFWCRRWPQLGFAALWMLITLLPALNLVPILHYRADRFFYLPLIGWSLAVVTIVRGLLDAISEPESARFRRAAAGAGLAVLVLLGLLTVRRNALFADDRTLFEATVRVSPFCREAHTALGDVYLRAGRNDDAVAQYQLALAAQPDRASYVVLPKVLINLGMAQLVRHDYAAAEEAFQQAHQLQPGLLHPLFGLGVSNFALGRVSTGVRWLEQAYEHDTTDPDVSFNLALGYDRLGRSRDASAMYRHYLDVAPRGRARALAEERLRALGRAP